MNGYSKFGGLHAPVFRYPQKPEGGADNRLPPAVRGLSLSFFLLFMYLFIYCIANRQVHPLTGEVIK